MTTYEGVLFDMDGVLVDSEPVHARAWQEVLTGLGYDFPSSFFVEWVGVPDERLAEHLVRDHDICLDEVSLLAKKRDVYRALMAQERPIPEGLAERLERLRERLPIGPSGLIPMAVATSSPTEEIPIILSAVGIYEMFSAWVGAQDVPVHKPAPDPYLLAAQKINVDPTRCIVVEDSPSGTAAGRAAGALVLGVSTTYSAEALVDADMVFASSTDALEWVLQNIEFSKP